MTRYFSSHGRSKRWLGCTELALSSSLQVVDRRKCLRSEFGTAWLAMAVQNNIGVNMPEEAQNPRGFGYIASVKGVSRSTVPREVVYVHSRASALNQ
jgi:hypothetical protein